MVVHRILIKTPLLLTSCSSVTHQAGPPAVQICGQQTLNPSTSAGSSMSLKARMNAMPCSGRKSAEVSICHSLLCHARGRMRYKHSQTCCKLVHLGFGACMHLFCCELSLCNRREHAFQFSCLWWWESKLSQEKLSWLCIQKVASSFEAVSKEMYWWAASSWQQSHDFVSSHFPTSSNIKRQHGCTPNMLQACAPWFWSLNAPVFLRAQPVQQERTTKLSSHWLLDIEKWKKSEKIPEVSSALHESRLSTD